MELQSRYADLRARGLGLAALSYDSRETLEAFARRYDIAFPLLSDPGSKIIETYGLLRRDLPASDKTYGIPYPGTFVLDARGQVVSKAFEEDYQDRNTVSSILSKSDGQGLAPAVRIASERMSIVVTASDESLAPGNRFSLIFDFTPRRNVHVYAPGVDNYIPLSIDFETDGLLRSHPAAFPPSEEYYFEPLDERVPVFQKPFKVTQDLTLLATREAQARLRTMETLTVKGTIRYQACDDKICFNPTDVPVTWTFKLKPLLRSQP